MEGNLLRPAAMNLVQLLSDRAVAHPDRVALIDRLPGRSRRTTYGQLERASQQLAQQLQQRGLQPGDGVLLLQPVAAELYAAIAAILRLGLVGIVLDPAANLAANLAQFPPRALLASRRALLLRWRYPILRQIPHVILTDDPYAGIDAAPPTAPLHGCTPETPALVAFTSGSTGRPKAMLRTHGLLLAQYEALKPVLQFREGAVEATALPLFVLPNLAAGLTVLLPPVNWRAPSRTRPRAAIAALRQHQASRLLAAPALLQRLTDWSLARGLVLPELRHIFLGGAPVLPKLIAELQQWAPRAAITAVYGSTEAEPIACLSHHRIAPADLAQIRAGGGLPAGQPVADIQVQILNPRANYATLLTPADFAACAQPVGQAGEIAVSGAHVLPSYLDPADNARIKLQVGDRLWHRTGDAGYLDRAGRLWLLGRCRGCVRDRHGDLYPLAVEAIANNYPGVRRSALVSLAGERALLLELSAPVELTALRQAIAPFQIHRLECCRRLPVDRRHNAKLDYTALERWLARRRRGTHCRHRKTGIR